MTFTIQSISTSNEVITIRHTLKLFCKNIAHKYEAVDIDEIITDGDSLPIPAPVWEWFTPPSDEFVKATDMTRLAVLFACRDEIVRQSRRES